MGPATPTAGSTASVRRVAILRALMLGDLLCAVPALRSFRGGLPNAEIVLVGLGWARELAARFDHLVDGFVELPGYAGLPEAEPREAELRPFFDQMRALELDLAVQLHGSGRVTNELVARFGARRTAGFFPAGEAPPDPEVFVRYPESGHEIHRLLALPRHLGLPDAGDELEFPLTPADAEELAAVAPSLEPGTYACLHPGARSAEAWPPERFAAVADELTRRRLHVVLTGSAAESALTRVVADAASAPVLDLAGKTSLGSLGALLAGAALLVSNDTGVSHLAAALRVPSVVVVTTSDPDRWAPLDRDLHRVVVRPPSAAPVVAEAESLLAARVAA